MHCINCKANFMTDKQDNEIIQQGHKFLDNLRSNEVPVSRCVLLMLDHVVACCNKPDLHWGSLPFYTEDEHKEAPSANFTKFKLVDIETAE